MGSIGADVTELRLTELSHGAGCGCKLSSAELNEVLAAMTVSGPTDDPDVLVGYESADDAGVFRITKDIAVVQSVDFFTPIVDDPRTWGRIAATNALSDLYAMGASPITALNLVSWPRETIGFDVLAEVLDGGSEVLRAAGCALLGGHSIDDPEPKYGVAVTGVAHPERLLTNAAAHPGDVLVLTKPLGTGIITTAVKRNVCPRASYDAAVDAMTTLNEAAMETALEFGVRAATDVTGFGLIGHMSEMLRASDVAAELDLSALPLLPNVRELVRDGVLAGGTRRNLADTAHVDWADAEEDDRILACDAQTSGGLLLAVAARDVDNLCRSLTDRDARAPAVVATVVEAAPSGPTITAVS